MVLELKLESDAEDVEEKAVRDERSDALDMVFLRPFVPEVLLEPAVLDGATGIVCVRCITAVP